MSQQLIESLQNPKHYPHDVTEITLIETHISWVLLTGTYAYKIKKPMNFGFLDFSTLEARKAFCEKEVGYNSPMSDLYETVIPLSGSPDAPELGGTGEAFEYAIRMKQFDQETLLSKLIDNHQLTPDHLEQAADALANFHDETDRLDANTDFGTPDSVFEAARDNFSTSLTCLQDQDRPDDLALFKKVQTLYAEAEKVLTDTIHQRKQGGFIKACHGDLHLNNMAMNDNRVVLFDCIEFNEHFRCIDTINDLAFLLMDLDHRNRQDLATVCLNRYLANTGDFQGMAVLPFYKAYRAMVRAKIHILTGLDPAQTEEGKQTQFALARSYGELALGYFTSSHPIAICMHGLSGSGKSYLAAQLAPALNAVVIRSDLERKRVFAEESPDGAGFEAGLYAPSVTEKLYQHLSETANFLLESGMSVIVDAACLKETQRKSLNSSLTITPIFISCEAELQTLKDRIAVRQAEGQDPSDADVSILEHQLAAFSPIHTDEGLMNVSIQSEANTSLKNILTEIEALASVDRQ